MKRFSKIIIIAVLLIASTFFGFYAGQQEGERKAVNQFFSQGAGENASNLDFTLFWETWQTLKEKFIDKTKFDNQKMLYGAISGVVNSLKDPYTVFMDPEESKRFFEDVSGKFEGVGMEIGQKKGQLQIISPLEGTPAQKAGLRAGDKIIKIDGIFANELTIDDAVGKIRGDKGTEITLTIFREGWNDTKEFKIVRDVIMVPSLKWEIKNDNIAYIKLYQFSEEAGYDFKKASLEILKSPAKRIILDLRNNPGGYLEISKEIASLFLKKGSVVAIEDFGGKTESKKYIADGNDIFSEFPIVVLINQGSASASEILAGALRDNRQIKLIGETSFGKGSVQEIKNLNNGSSLKVTVAKWLTPKGESISDHGLVPDIEIEITDKDYQDDKDPQLDKALEILETIR
ncbi:MAG: S41 family peptidase [Parcubacteria group bacterium CG_4_10_14_0_2_um_filter_7_35_8]|nr:MAG: S41 family peptidase [Parcubacteria group bacterium CG_4_10_14_0_2_um_filter_7_35_8]